MIRHSNPQDNKYHPFPNYKQQHKTDDGPACLQILCKYFGKSFTADYVRSLWPTVASGSPLQDLGEAAGKVGFGALGAKVSLADLLDLDLLPCIGYWDQCRFIVVYKIRGDKIYVSDPAAGLITFDSNDFLRGWTQDGEYGIMLYLDPTPPDF
jgi:ATP-binding cassette subfamily B protein